MIYLFLVLCAAFFYYAFSHRVAYSNEKIIYPSRFYNYSLLFSCILFIFIAVYLQFQYKIFDGFYPSALFISSVLFLFLAYYFDHIGVLSLALTGLTTWVEIAIHPIDLTNILSNDPTVTNASIFFAFFLALASTALKKKNIKSHFTFTYYNFAASVLFFYSITGIMQSELKYIYLFPLLISGIFFIDYARRMKSFYFLMISVASLYIGFTYLAFHYFEINVIEGFISVKPYFIISGILFILLILNYRKLFRK